MKLLTLLIFFLMASAHAANIGDDSVNLGDGNNPSTEKAIIFNDGSPLANRKKISIDGTTKNLKSNSNVFELGDNTASDKSIILNKGGVNPEIKWNDTLSRWEFSSDGTLYKAFGSGSGSGDGGVNLIGNSGFEDGIALEWLNVGGTFTQETYATPTDNNSKFARFVASGAGQYFETTAKVIPSFLGFGCMADIKYFSATNNAFKIQAIDGSANVLAEQTLALTSSIVKSPTITFPCPAVAGTVKLRVESLIAATIDADDGYIGGNKGIVSSSQANVLGTLKISGCSTNFSTASLTLAGLGTNTSCVYTATGKVLAPSTQVAGFRISKVPKGRLAIRALGAFQKSNTTTNSSLAFVISDRSNLISGAENFGTAATGSGLTHGFPSISGNIPSGAVTSNVNFEIFGRTTVASSPALIDVTIPLEFEVLFFPDESDTGFLTNDQSGWFIDANIGGANPSLGTTAITSYASVGDNSLDLVLNPGSASAKIPCNSTNPATGLTCAVGNEQVGAVFTPPYAGHFDVCFYFTHSVGMGTSSGIETTFQSMLTANASQTILTEGKQRTTSGSSLGGTSALGTINPVTTCGTFNFSDTSEKTVRLMYEQAVSGAVSTSAVLADRSGTTGQRDIRVTVRPSTMNIARPVLTGDQVTSDGTTNPKLMGFSYGGNADCTSICGSGVTCTLCRPIGVASGVTMVGQPTTGDYRINGIDGNKWNCEGAAISGTSTAFVKSKNPQISTSFHEVVSYISGTGANSYTLGTITCVGKE